MTDSRDAVRPSGTDPLRGAVLAMEAAAGPGTIAVLRDGVCLAEASVEMRSMAEEHFFPAVLETLQRAHLSIADLHAIVIGAGPGSFTALRVIGAIAKGLAEGRGLPLYAVPSLAWTATGPGTTRVRLDALRGESYVAAIHRAKDGEVTAIEHLGCLPTGEIGEAAAAAPHAREAPHLLALARTLGPVDLAAWEPLYGRLAEAQVKWEAAHGRPLRAESVRIRPATPADLSAIQAIERGSFSDPWSVAMFAEVLASPVTRCLAAERGAEVVGYAIVQRVGPEAELLNVAVHPSHRRQGLGDALLAEVLRAFDAVTGVTVFLEVRASNAAAEALYRRHGFRPVGRRRGYYRDPLEDALLMQRAPVGGDD